MPLPSHFRAYCRSSSVVFCKTKEQFGGFSNMAGGFPIRVNRTFINTSEALYQACRFPHLPEVQRLIISQASPMTAKMKSKPYRKRTRPDWETVRVRIMRWCLRVKLAQNWGTFGNLLLSTGSLPIVEESRRDDFWGAKASSDDMLIGANVLGRLLMELREELTQTNDSRLKCVPPLDIPDFCLYGEPIQAIGNMLQSQQCESNAASSYVDVASNYIVTNNDANPDSTNSIAETTQAQQINNRSPARYRAIRKEKHIQLNLIITKK